MALENNHPPLRSAFGGPLVGMTGGHVSYFLPVEVIEDFVKPWWGKPHPTNLLGCCERFQDAGSGVAVVALIVRDRDFLHDVLDLGMIPLIRLDFYGLSHFVLQRADDLEVPALLEFTGRDGDRLILQTLRHILNRDDKAADIHVGLQCFLFAGF